MIDTPPTARLGIAALVLTGAALTLGGCADESADAVSGPAAAVKEEIPNSDLARLTLTPKAVERLGLITVEVEAGADRAITVPYGALIYDHGGDTWVYTNPEPEVFIRAAVDVERIEGDTVHLLSGPEPGTSVVTLGAAELYGAEFDTAD
ncbi:MAG: hypothetical protein WA962_10195 [Ornithinimicrobium sp.]